MKVQQDWTTELTLMQQGVLMASVRGPDGVEKYHPCKYLLRWYRRCVLLCGLESEVIYDPSDQRGGSFTGPSIGPLNDGSTWQECMDELVTKYLQHIDELPLHFHLHFLHAIEIVGYKHPIPEIQEWWLGVYCRLVRDLHLHVETEKELDYRLGDSEAQWKEMGDVATYH